MNEPLVYLAYCMLKVEEELAKWKLSEILITKDNRGKFSVMAMKALIIWVTFQFSVTTMLNTQI